MAFYAGVQPSIIGVSAGGCTPQPRSRRRLRQVHRVHWLVRQLGQLAIDSITHATALRRPSLVLTETIDLLQEAKDDWTGTVSDLKLDGLARRAPYKQPSRNGRIRPLGSLSWVQCLDALGCNIRCAHSHTARPRTQSVTLVAMRASSCTPDARAPVSKPHTTRIRIAACTLHRWLLLRSVLLWSVSKTPNPTARNTINASRTYVYLSIK